MINRVCNNGNRQFGFFTHIRNGYIIVASELPIVGVLIFFYIKVISVNLIAEPGGFRFAVCIIYLYYRIVYVRFFKAIFIEIIIFSCFGNIFGIIITVYVFNIPL